jgi:hypothetical protein
VVVDSGERLIESLTRRRATSASSEAT